VVLGDVVVVVILAIEDSRSKENDEEITTEVYLDMGLHQISYAAAWTGILALGRYVVVPECWVNDWSRIAPYQHSDRAGGPLTEYGNHCAV